MVAEFIGVAGISIMVGIVIGAFIMWQCFRCDHQFEEIANVNSLEPGKNRVVVHMCKKCGKRKITRV